MPTRETNGKNKHTNFSLPKKLYVNKRQSRPSQASLMTPLPVPDPTTSRLGDSAMASASRSRRPSSVCSMEDMCRSPKPSGQLPHTSSRVTLRSKVPAAHTGHLTLSPRLQRAAHSFGLCTTNVPACPGPLQSYGMDEGQSGQQETMVCSTEQNSSGHCISTCVSRE